MPLFLSPEWIDAVQEKMNADDEIVEFAGWAYVTLQHVATDVPDRGEVRHWRRFADGKAELALGEIPDPDATLTTTYEDAVALNKGEFELQAAFARGKLQVDGDMTKLLQFQDELKRVAAAARSVPAEY